MEYSPGRNPVFSQQGVDKILQHLLRVQAPIGTPAFTRNSHDDALAILRAQVYGLGTTHHGPVAWLQTEAWDAIHIPIKYGGGPLAWAVAQDAARATSSRVGIGSHGLLLLGATDGSFGALFRALQNACPHCLPGQGGPAALMPRRASILTTAPGQTTLQLTDPLTGYHALWHVASDGQLLPDEVLAAVTAAVGAQVVTYAGRAEGIDPDTELTIDVIELRVRTGTEAIMKATFGVQGLLNVGDPRFPRAAARIFKALLTVDPIHVARTVPPALQEQLTAGRVLANAQLRRQSSHTHIVEAPPTDAYGVPIGEPGIRRLAFAPWLSPSTPCDDLSHPFQPPFSAMG